MVFQEMALVVVFTRSAVPIAQIDVLTVHALKATIAFNRVLVLLAIPATERATVRPWGRAVASEATQVSTAVAPAPAQY